MSEDAQTRQTAVSTPRLYLAEIAERAALIGLAAFIAGLALTASPHLGPAHDEPADITAGYVFLRSGVLPEGVRRPLIGPLLESVGLIAAWGEGVRSWPGYPERDLERLTAHALASVDVPSMLWWARLTGLLATMLTVFLVHRWAALLWRSSSAGLLAATLFALLPTTLAHATRADGAALTSLFLTGAALAGWRWLRREGSGQAAAGYAIAALFTDFAVWVLIPFVLVLALLRWAGLPPAADRIKRIDLPLDTALHSPAATSASPLAQRLIRGAWMGSGRWILIGLLLIALIAEIIGRWSFVWNHWVLSVRHWTDWRGSVLPLMFFGRLHVDRPALYHVGLLITKTPLWLPLLWGVAVWSSRRGRWLDAPRRDAMIYLMSGLAGYLLLGCWLFPARGFTPWVPLLPIVCAIAGGSALWAQGGSTPVRHLLRHAAVGALMLWALWRLFIAAPLWHAEWNLPVRLLGVERQIALAPENDSGPAVPLLWSHLVAEGLANQPIYFAHHGRWAPSGLGMEALLLPSHGPLLERQFRFDTANPPPGLYAISSTLLLGQDLLYADTYRHFREREPLEWFGPGLGLWRVEREGGSAEVTRQLNGEMMTPP